VVRHPAEEGLSGASARHDLEVVMLVLFFVLAGVLLAAAFVVAGSAGAAAAAADGAFAADVPEPPRTAAPSADEGTVPALFPCGCAARSVKLGMCDIFAPDGSVRPHPAVDEGWGEPDERDAGVSVPPLRGEGGGA
jgi:hypothetical protein